MGFLLTGISVRVEMAGLILGSRPRTAMTGLEWRTCGLRPFATRLRSSGVEQRWRTPSGVSVVEYHPGVVMLRGIRPLAQVEPPDPLSQYHDGRERRRRHQLGGPMSGDPLQAHQQRELALYRGSERQRMAYKVQHRF